jgi:outer membrane biosynthesis protein TonB
MDAITTPAKTDAQLAAQIKDAMKAIDAATATRNEKQAAAGRLLLEARQRHPTEKAFANFLQLAGGVGLRRAQDLIAFAQWRKDFEKHQIDNKAAQQRHRDKLREEKIERGKREKEERERAALSKPDPKPDPKNEPKPRPEPKGKPEPNGALRNARNNQDHADWSAAKLEEFERACVTCLPGLNEADLKKAVACFNSAWKRATSKEAAA